MSTVAITDLEPGTQPTSTAVNATLTSWVTATAAGAIGADNVRVEGVDRRTLSAAGHVVATAEVGNNTIVSSSSSTSTTNVTGSYVVVPCGATNLETVDMTIASASDVLVHASLSVEGTAVATGSPVPRVWFVLQSSADGGASWSDISGTRRDLRIRDISGVLVNIPPVIGPPTWCAYTAASGTVRFRVGFQTENGTFTLSNGTIFCEILGC